jgi:hypothetical protein
MAQALQAALPDLDIKVVNDTFFDTPPLATGTATSASVTV